MRKQVVGDFQMIARRAILLMLFVAFGMPGCASLPRGQAVPPMLTQDAVVLNRANIRFWPDLSLDPLVRGAIASNVRESQELIRRGGSGALPPATFLAISGGGDAGAFGAGVLVGWSQHGDRPEFKVVTGVSAGALIAPFAFLGSSYDSVLRDVSLSLRAKDILHFRNILAVFSEDGMADARPLARIIARYVTPDLLAAIANEYAKGRMLLISTTDLDSRQPVIWDMGVIATSHDPRALPLFREILLASAAVPGIFPPVMVDVSVGGRRYQEMHVDGGVMTEAFLFPQPFVGALAADGPLNIRERRVYVIRNGHIGAQWQPVARRTTVVAHRALDALIEAQGANDIYRLETVAQQEHEDFNVAYIGDDFTYPHARNFATDYMRHLFEYAYMLAATGNPWHKALPHAILATSRAP